jgi:cell division transport system permease protein
LNQRTRSSATARRPAKTPPKPAERSLRGAVVHATPLSQRFQSWQRHHRDCARQSLRQLAQQPLQTLMTALLIAIALALPTLLFVVINSVQSLGERWDAKPTISVYLKLDTQESQIPALLAELRARNDIASVTYISPSEALQSFQALAGFGQALSALDSNPLPPTLDVTPASHLESPAQLGALADNLASLAAVESVDIDLDWVRRLREMMVLGRQLVVILASLLSLGVLLALGNSIRLAIENRRDEIVVVKLVGGTHSFVRRPFLYTGIWYGFWAGWLAVVLVMIGHQMLAAKVGNLAAAYQSNFVLDGLTALDYLSLVMASSALGLLSAWLAVGKHLSELEPQ